jgi:hypothetical protein
MTAVTGGAQLFCLLPELVCGSGLTGIISGGCPAFGDVVEGIEILTQGGRGRRVDRRAVGRYAGFRLRRKEMREGGKQGADAVGTRF